MRGASAGVALSSGEGAVRSAWSDAKPSRLEWGCRRARILMMPFEVRPVWRDGRVAAARKVIHAAAQIVPTVRTLAKCFAARH